jgi:hypothetical protein
MHHLTPVWNQIEKMLAENISIIPVRDRNEITKDGTNYAAKTPYKSWKVYQSEIITKEELWHQMELRDTTAVAIVCGRVSGNLEVIDIDVKFKGGIEIILFEAIKTYRPDIWAKLRIHKSPSGGFHIIFRVILPAGTTMPGNQKLAKRPPTPAELDANPKDRSKCFIETRGEGGYVLAPPSMGYSIAVDNPIPTLTWEEREALMNICKLLDEMPKVAPAPARTKADIDYYAESPWDAFNQSGAGEDVLLQYGWTKAGESADYVHYTRPGKDHGISASFIKSKRMFFVFTTNAGIDADRGYHPSTVLAELGHNGDKKAAFKWLVSNGFGKINPKFEKAIARKAAIQGTPVPANLSQEARQYIEETKSEIAETYPYGIYWMEDEDDKMTISRERFTQIAAGLGFRLYRGDIIRLAPPLIHKTTDREFYDQMKAYIQEDDAVEYYRIADATEAFIQRSGAFTITRLPILTQKEILRDTPTTAWKAFQNGVVKVTKDAIDLVTYADIPALVWAHTIQQREFHRAKKPIGKYIEFLQLACELDKHPEYIQSIVGYLAHDYKDETTGYIVVLTEQCADPKDGGGSGKNMFGNLLKHTTSYISKAGAQTKFDEKFFQVWKGERIFAISDVPKNFDFAFLKEPATGAGVLKKLYQDEEVISVEDMPKFMVQTNFSYEISDGGLKRRIIPIEFTDFFTNCGGIDVHFGCHFPLGWSTDDWSGFDNFIMNSIQLWMQHGRKIKPLQLTNTGWHKQMEHTYGVVVMGFIEMNFGDWLKMDNGILKNSDFRTQLEAYYSEQNVPKHYQPSMPKINNAIREYCQNQGVLVESDKLIKIEGHVHKVRIFTDLKNVPF